MGNPSKFVGTVNYVLLAFKWAALKIDRYCVDSEERKSVLYL
jgi:hypothetical protein